MTPQRLTATEIDYNKDTNPELTGYNGKETCVIIDGVILDVLLPGKECKEERRFLRG